MAKIKLDDDLHERARRAAEKAGYPSIEDFFVHVLEKELAVLESAESDREVTDRLRGLGYLE